MFRIAKCMVTLLLFCLLDAGAAFAQAEAKGTHLPGPHSNEFAPLLEPTIRTGVKAMTAAVFDLLKK